MTDFQFQLLIGTILGSMLLIILVVVIAVRVLYLWITDSRLITLRRMEDSENRIQLKLERK